MKKLLIYSADTPLGNGLHSISTQFKAKEQAYIVPSASYIRKIKQKLSNLDPLKLKQIEFLTFDQLTRKIMIQEQKHLLSSSEQELLVKMAVEQVQKEKGLAYFKESTEKIGWLHQVELWIGEVKRAGVRPAKLIELYKNGEEKYLELIKIYQAYQHLLASFDLIDHEQPYFDLLDQLSNQRLVSIPYKGIIVEQFYDFSPLQMEVLDRLGTLGIQINIHQLYDSTRSDLFQWTKNTIDYLTHLGFETIEKPMNDDLITNTASLSRISYLKKELFSENPKQFPQDQEQKKNDITLFSASGIKQELEMVATEINQLAYNKELKLEEIAIVLPKIENYKNDLEQVMEEFHIPIRLRKTEKLIDNPMIQSLISLLKALHGNKNDWISMLLSPYFKWKVSVDHYRWLLHFRGLGYPVTKKLWQERIIGYTKGDEEKEKEIQQMDILMNQIFDFQIETPKKGNYKQFVDYLNGLEKELAVKERLKQAFLNNTDDNIAYRDLMAYEELNRVKEELINLDKLSAENEAVPFWEWVQSFIIALEKRDYDATQGDLKGVHVLSPNQIRGQTFQMVFVMGLVEGEFPKAIKNNWLLPDQERLWLRENQVLLNTSRDFENQQKYNFYQSIVAAEEQLYLIYSAKTEDGKERLRSFYIDEVVEILGQNIRTKERDNGDLVPKLWADCVTDQQRLKKGLKELTGKEFDQKQLAIKNIQEISSLTINQRLNIRYGIEGEYDRWHYHSAYDGYITEKNIKNLIKDRIEKKVWSNTKLNEAMSCRFSFFAKDILRLTEWEEQDEALNPIEKGNFMHRILQRFYQTFQKENERKILPKHQEIYENELLEIAKEEWNLFLQEGQRYLDPILSDISFERLLQQLEEMLLHELSWREKAESYFYPQYLEFSFGTPLNAEEKRKQIVDPLSTTEKAVFSLEHHTIRLQGKIDRIDINDEGQFVIYDYKSGGTPANKEIKEGIHLQLPLYLLVVESLLGLSREKAIGLAFYTPTNRTTGFWKQEHLSSVGLSNRIGSKYSEDEWNGWLELVKQRINQLVDQLLEGDFTVLPQTECPSYCSFQNICRKDEERMKKKKLLGEDQNGISING